MKRNFKYLVSAQKIKKSLFIDNLCAKFISRFNLEKALCLVLNMLVSLPEFEMRFGVLACKDRR